VFVSYSRIRYFRWINFTLYTSPFSKTSLSGRMVEMDTSLQQSRMMGSLETAGLLLAVNSSLPRKRITFLLAPRYFCRQLGFEMSVTRRWNRSPQNLLREVLTVEHHYNRLGSSITPLRQQFASCDLLIDRLLCTIAGGDNAAQVLSNLTEEGLESIRQDLVDELLTVDKLATFEELTREFDKIWERSGKAIKVGDDLLRLFLLPAKYSERLSDLFIDQTTMPVSP
jgi:hypothetical protein